MLVQVEDVYGAVMKELCKPFCGPTVLHCLHCAADQLVSDDFAESRFEQTYEHAGGLTQARLCHDGDNAFEIIKMA